MQGIKEINVPPLEPLLLSEIKMNNGPQQAKIACNLSDVQVWGPSTFKIIDLK